MRFEFDPQKAIHNLRKHGVSLGDAEAVLDDPLALHIEDPDARGEQRFLAVGASSTGTVLVVVYAYETEAVRAISARRASRRERRQYESRVRLLEG